MPLFNVPVDVTFSRRVDRPDGTGMDWVEEGFSEIFANRKVIIFGLPGAFTPTCSTTHLPGFEAYAQQLKKDHNIDDIYCVSVNDPFVMQAWFAQQNIKNVKNAKKSQKCQGRVVSIFLRCLLHFYKFIFEALFFAKCNKSSTLYFCIYARSTPNWSLIFKKSAQSRLSRVRTRCRRLVKVHFLKHFVASFWSKLAIFNLGQ